MIIKVIGKANFTGVSKKTGNPYNFNQVHYIGKARGVIGDAALTISLDPAMIAFSDITVGDSYEVEFDQRGYCVSFLPVNSGNF